MCGLGHFIEDEGIPTVVISLIRRHTEVMKPPRGLFVPFELGRPFGAAGEPDLQRRILLDALKLLERVDGPVLEDFPDAALACADRADADEGWACPVNLAPPPGDLSDTGKLAAAIRREVGLLEPWYAESVKNAKGRRLDGVTGLSREEIIAHLTAFLDDQDIPGIVGDEPVLRSVKLAADDLRHFYYQAALAKPGIRSDVELADWFYGETGAGKLHIRIRETLMASDDEATAIAGRTYFVPNAMLKYT